MQGKLKRQPALLRTGHSFLKDMNPRDVEGWQCFDVEKMPSLRLRNRRFYERFSGIPFSDQRVRPPFHRSIMHTKKVLLHHL